jgi:PPOX class probable F420-dependent enzyme
MPARMASGALALLEDHNYINLETFKKDGRSVVTPVWFMVDGQNVIVVTTSDTGKAKRTKNNAAVRIMPSGFSGEPKGDWIKGSARFANPDEMKKAFELRGKKYGSGEGLASSLSSYSESGRPVAIIITPD